MTVHTSRLFIRLMTSGEGLAERIGEYFSNTYTYFTEGMNASLAKPLDWLEEQDTWARAQVAFPFLPHSLF